MRYHEPPTTVNSISESRQNCVEHMKIPLNLPLQRDFLSALLKKGRRGNFWKHVSREFNSVK
jgi:hypothetical protein